VVSDFFSEPNQQSKPRAIQRKLADATVGTSGIKLTATATEAAKAKNKNDLENFGVEVCCILSGKFGAKDNFQAL
jgi:hypothetical protein